MNDDWRLRIDLHDDGFAHRLSELLESEELEHDLERSFQDRVVVSVDGPTVFCYTGTRSQAEGVERVVRQLAEQHGFKLELDLTHWHPTAEQWENPDVPLPADEAAAVRSARNGSVRNAGIRLVRAIPSSRSACSAPTRAQAGELSRTLEDEGIPNLHRWSYVLIGATDEDSAPRAGRAVER